jgi:hypothetical protein
MAETVIKNEPTYLATQWTGDNQQEIVDAILEYRPYGELNSADVDEDGTLQLDFIAAGRYALPADHWLLFGPVYGAHLGYAVISIETPQAFAEVYSAQ